MSSYLALNTDSNGTILDPNFKDEIQDLTSATFNYDDYYVFSHGWWTDFEAAAESYNRFSTGFARQRRIAAGTPDVSQPMLAAIHWPSMLSEDRGNPINLTEASTFYTMEKRADNVGWNGVYALLRLVIEGRKARDGAFNINLIGHSFGCKVVCAALESLVATYQPWPANARINLILLQAAFNSNALEPGGPADAGGSFEYGTVINGIPNIRILITKSSLDTALTTAYPLAHKVFSLFHPDQTALGATGPTNGIRNLFGASVADLDVGVGFGLGLVPNRRLIVANLTPLHQNDGYPADAASGHHSDIFGNEIYNLIMGFLA